MESVLLRLSQAGLHHWRRILWWLCLILDFQLHQFQIVSNCEVIKVTWDAFASQVSWPKRDEFCASKPCDPLKLSDWSSQPSSGSSRRILRCPTKHTHTHTHTHCSKRSTSTSHEESSERSKLWFTTVPATVLSLGYYFCLKRNFEHWLSFAKGRSEFNRIHVHSCQESLGSVV